MVEARLGASACGACNVGGTSGGVRVEGGSVVKCCWETKASIKCKMAVRAMALAVKKRECGKLVSMAVVEGGMAYWRKLVVARRIGAISSLLPPGAAASLSLGKGNNLDIC